MKNNNIPENSPLGKTSNYKKQYDPSLLYQIPRSDKRTEINILNSNLPFDGYDLWRAYEFSWLNLKGKPEVAILEFYIPCKSEFIVESKSLKLYLFSFSNSKFDSFTEIHNILQNDLSKALNTKDLKINKIDLNESNIKLSFPQGISLDNADITMEFHDLNPQYLSAEPNQVVSESLYSNLLKSNCLVTNQPDWGTVEINYTGPKINRENLLKYIVSFRNHNEFHEQCIERIFNDILEICKPEKLKVSGFYTRRGGIDINPMRINYKYSLPQEHIRLYRQ